MPRYTDKTKTQPAKRTRNQPSSRSTSKGSKSKPELGRKRGNQGNFHGIPLKFLDSWFPAYIAASGKKKVFWADFFKAWDQKFPPLPLEDKPTSSKPLNSLVDGYGSEPEESESEANDPHVHFARTVSRPVGVLIYLFIFVAPNFMAPTF